jgi:hypothetical protein
MKDWWVKPALVWAITCLVGSVLVFGWWIENGNKYEGKEIRLTLNVPYPSFKVQAPSITIEMASEMPYVLTGPAGEQIEGSPEGLLGVLGKEIYWTKPLQIQGGEWSVSRNSVLHIRLSGSEVIKAERTVDLREKIANAVAFLIVSGFVWIIGLLILSMIGDAIEARRRRSK